MELVALSAFSSGKHVGVISPGITSTLKYAGSDTIHNLDFQGGDSNCQYLTNSLAWPTQLGGRKGPSHQAFTCCRAVAPNIPQQNQLFMSMRMTQPPALFSEIVFLSSHGSFTPTLRRLEDLVQVHLAMAAGHHLRPRVHRLHSLHHRVPRGRVNEVLSDRGRRFQRGPAVEREVLKLGF